MHTLVIASAVVILANAYNVPSEEASGDAHQVVPLEELEVKERIRETGSQSLLFRSTLALPNVRRRPTALK